MIRIQGTLRLLLKISFLFSCVQSLILLQSHVSTNKAAPINPKIMDQNISREPQSKHSPLRSLNIIGRKSFILSTSSFFWSATLFPSLVLSETDVDQPAAPSTKYYTGKQPVVPGGKPREKGDVKGTKKDPQFLLSISQCKVRRGFLVS